MQIIVYTVINCVYVHVCICMCVYVCLCVCVCVYACVYVCVTAPIINKHMYSKKLCKFIENYTGKTHVISIFKFDTIDGKK